MWRLAGTGANFARGSVTSVSTRRHHQGRPPRTAGNFRSMREGKKTPAQLWRSPFPKLTALATLAEHEYWRGARRLLQACKQDRQGSRVPVSTRALFPRPLLTGRDKADIDWPVSRARASNPGGSYCKTTLVHMYSPGSGIIALEFHHLPSRWKSERSFDTASPVHVAGIWSVRPLAGDRVEFGAGVQATADPLWHGFPKVVVSLILEGFLPRVVGCLFRGSFLSVIPR